MEPTNHDDRAGTGADRKGRKTRRIDLLIAFITMIVIVAVAQWCVANLISIWPSVEAVAMESKRVDTTLAVTSKEPMTQTGASTSYTVRRFWKGGEKLWHSPIELHAPMTPDVRVLLLTLLAGAIGAAISSLTLLTGFVGNQTFKRRWLMWYLARLPIGAMLGLFVTLAIQGGLPIDTLTFDGANPFQICFLAGLAGLFSRAALDKLEDVFDTILKSERNKDRKDDLKPAEPEHDGGAASVQPTDKLSSNT